MNHIAEHLRDEMTGLTMKAQQDRNRKYGQAKGDRFGSTYTWRIEMKDRRILNGYSKFEGSREKDDKLEILLDNVKMFFKWDYMGSGNIRANKIDYFLNRSHKIEDAVLMFTLYPTSWIFHRKEMETAEKFAPLRDLLTQMYLDPAVNSYQDPTSFFADNAPAKPVENLVGTLTRLTPKPGTRAEDFLTLDQILDPNRVTSRTPEEFANHIKRIRNEFGNQIPEEHFQHFKTRVYTAKPHLRRF